jgi:hypothetical protein
MMQPSSVSWPLFIAQSQAEYCHDSHACVSVKLCKTCQLPATSLQLFAQPAGLGESKLPAKVHQMNFLLRIVWLTMASLVLMLALVIGSVFVLVSAVRWLFTGQKPTLVVYAQAYQRWKHMAQSDRYSKYPDETIIDAEIREVPEQRLTAHKKEADRH